MSLLDALLLDPAPFEVWIAYRTDGIKGSGTMDDPFDGSTQALFDSRMSELPSNTCVHLGPCPSPDSPFLTGGSAVWTPKERLKIVGSGMDITVLQLSTVTSGLNFVVAHPLDAGKKVDSFDISDLTIDCNLGAGGSTSSCGAVRVMGNHARIRRVKATHWGSKSSGPACDVFSVITGAADDGVTEVVNAGIENCIAIDPDGILGGSVTAFNVGGQDDITFTKESHAKSPFIRNSFADFGITPGMSTPKGRGISMGWCRGGLVEGNHIYNADIGGPYQANRSIRDLIVRNNFFKNVGVGIQFNLGLAGTEVPLVDISETSLGSLRAIAVTDGGVPHGLDVGDRVRVEPDSGLAAVRGVFIVSATPDAATFEFNLLSSPQGNDAGAAYKVLSVSRAIIEGNVIELASGSSTVSAILVQDGNDSNGFDETPDYVHGDVIVRNNKIRYVDGAPPADDNSTLIELQGVKNLIVENNVIDTISDLPMKNTRGAHATYFNNRTPAGKLLLGYDEDLQRKYGELETDAEDAFVLAFLEKR